MLEMLRSRRRQPASLGEGEERTITSLSLSPSTVPGQISPENAMTVGDAFACVRALSEAAASLPLIVYRRTDRGRERLSNRTAELLQRPAPGVTQAGLIGSMVAHLNLFGNAYLGKFRDEEGRVAQLGLLPPDRVQVEMRSGVVTFVVHNSNGRASRHGFDDICHVKALSTDGLVGLSPVRQARRTLELSRALSEHAQRFFENDARPGGILKAPVRTTAQLEELQSAWGVKYQGAKNAGRIAVMAGDVDFVPVSMPADDMQFLEQRKLSATEVARIFRVPPWIIGAEDGGSFTYANVEAQNLQFVTYSLRPWLVQIEQAMSNDRDLFQTTSYCEFLLDGLLRSDSKSRAEVYAMALDPERGWMTREEVRRLENLEREDPPPTVARWAPGPSPAGAEDRQLERQGGDGQPVIYVDVHVPEQPAPVVNVAPPKVVVEPQIVVEQPAAKQIELKRDAQGRLVGASVTERT